MSGAKHLVIFFSPLGSAQNDIPDFLTFARGLLSAETILTTSVKTGTKNITLVAAYPSVPIKPDLFAKPNTALAEV